MQGSGTGSGSRTNAIEHLPPEGRRREAFDGVVLRFARGEYRDPKWLGYRVEVKPAWAGLNPSSRRSAGRADRAACCRNGFEPLAAFGVFALKY